MYSGPSGAREAEGPSATGPCLKKHERKAGLDHTWTRHQMKLLLCQLQPTDPVDARHMIARGNALFSVALVLTLPHMLY